ncbi:MAG: tetratricopeptide repeat protein, partial [Variibacter sp.]|nr:tetratricopeptide repeat protein [Variibacter sp.]
VGDRPGALAAYKESLAITRALAAGDPHNVGWQRAVGAALDRIGLIQRAMGDHAEATAAFEESLSILRTLIAKDAGNTRWQRDLGTSLNRVGDARRTAGDPAGALASYEEGLATIRRLVAIDPGNADWQIDLVLSLYKVSTTATPALARARLSEALAIVERLEGEGKLTPVQRSWAPSFRDMLAKLSPETADSR